MIYRIKNIDDLEKIKNPLLKKDAEKYLDLYNRFLNNIEASGVKISNYDYSLEEEKLINEIVSLGGIVRHDGKSIVVNGCSPSCDHCRTGYGSATYILTLDCNRDCYFCTNKNQADKTFGDPKVFNIIDEFLRDLKTYKKMYSIAITGGEPLIHPDKCSEFIKIVKSKDENIQTRIYTNGDLVTEEILLMLKDAGLDEIRFGLKPDENGLVEESVLEKLSLATKYIKRTMVEMPLSLGHIEEMKSLMDKLDDLNIFGINILEFLYPYVHADEYLKKDYQIKNRPYKILYSYDYAGGVAVSGSQLECLEIVKYCLNKSMKMSVHYCSLENKLTSQLYMTNFGVKLTGTEFFSDKDFFIKTIRAYGDDSIKIKEIFDRVNIEHYIYDKTNNILEFNPKYVSILKNSELENIELGLSYLSAVYDERYNCNILKEFLVEKIVPNDFDILEI